MKLVLLFLTILTIHFSFCRCTIIATAGYVAAAYPVRNMLISSGLGDVIKNSATSLYEKSGFRYAGDQGTAIRKAVMNDHRIVEVDANDQPWRNGTESISTEHSQESRLYSERLFGVLNQMDKNACISRLLCEIGAEPSAFGTLGLKIKHYIQSVPPVTWNSATFQYIEGFKAGMLKGKGICLQHYLSCTYDLNRVVDFIWQLVHPVSS